MDDGSTDKSLEVAYGFKDKRIRLITLSDNKGPSYARNRGIEKAKGESVCFVDADDFVTSTILETLNVNADMSIGGFDIDDTSAYPTKNMLDEFLKAPTGKSPLNYVWAKLYKTSIAKRIKFDESMRVCEDLLFNLNFLCQAETIEYLDFWVYCYNTGGAAGKQIINEPLNFLACITPLYYLCGDRRKVGHWVCYYALEVINQLFVLGNIDQAQKIINHPIVRENLKYYKGK